jgi:putative SOS response-associated peptidase YedK
VCGRFVATSEPGDLGRLFAVDDLEIVDLPPNPNVAPTEPVAGVLERRGRRRLVELRWGLIPSWSTDRRIANRLINARAETVADLPAFRDAFRRRRCLLPADGYYEWERRPDGSRMPYLLAASGGETLAFAGLWEVWTDPSEPEAEPLRTCTIVTTDASPSIAWLHDRMPVILPVDAWDEWLDRDNHDTATLRHLLVPARDGALACSPASPALNDPRNKDLALLPQGEAGSAALDL